VSKNAKGTSVILRPMARTSHRSWLCHIYISHDHTSLPGHLNRGFVCGIPIKATTVWIYLRVVKNSLNIMPIDTTYLNFRLSLMEGVFEQRGHIILAIVVL
jgi:hypothetical protein